MNKDSVIELFLSFVLLFFNLIHFYHLICFYVLYSFSHSATFFNKLELSWDNIDLSALLTFVSSLDQCLIDVMLSGVLQDVEETQVDSVRLSHDDIQQRLSGLDWTICHRLDWLQFFECQRVTFIHVNCHGMCVQFSRQPAVLSAQNIWTFNTHNKKITLSQRWLCDAPNMWVPWKLYVSAKSAYDYTRIATLQSYHYSAVKLFSKYSNQCDHGT